MERMRSSLQSWVEDHKLSTIGAVWATAAAGASVAYSRRRRRRSPARGTGVHARMHAQALTLAVLGGAALALAHRYYGGKSDNKKQQEDLDYGFYSQLPPATDADGNENERWSW